MKDRYSIIGYTRGVGIWHDVKAADPTTALRKYANIRGCEPEELVDVTMHFRKGAEPCPVRSARAVSPSVVTRTLLESTIPVTSWIARPAQLKHIQRRAA